MKLCKYCGKEIETIKNKKRNIFCNIQCANTFNNKNLNNKNLNNKKRNFSDEYKLILKERIKIACLKYAEKYKGKTYEEIHGIEKANELKKKISESLIGKSKGKALTLEKELERRKKISETMKNNPKAGGLREGSGRGVKTWYESKIAGKVYLRSTYELEYAKWLDNNNVNWKQNSNSFEYFFNNKNRKYYPDFYLIDEDCYVETKGFKTEQDLIKWNNFPHKLKILFGEDLLKLGLNIKL